MPDGGLYERWNTREAEVFLHHADGYRVPVIVRASPIRNEQGNIIGAVETFSNNEGAVNTRRQLNEIQQTALTDSLTEVGNRRYLENRLSIAIAENRQLESPIGLLFIDIDELRLLMIFMVMRLETKYCAWWLAT